jgi:hypothetical protein
VFDRVEAAQLSGDEASQAQPRGQAVPSLGRQGEGTSSGAKGRTAEEGGKVESFSTDTTLLV